MPDKRDNLTSEPGCSSQWGTDGLALLYVFHSPITPPMILRHGLQCRRDDLDAAGAFESRR